ncbi:MAG: acyl-CoA dehydrogenase family protein [Actinomycetota bacterium]|nr:acyl-CoA dehydrogenase family protein [Actinomycetota bacterium]
MTNVPVTDDEFREELRDWIADHLVGQFADHRGVGGPADDTAWEVRLEWERLLARDKWLNASWPVEYGGRGATPRQELIFHIEHAAAGGPYWCGVQGRDLFGPTLLEFGTAEQKARFLPEITGVREFWGQGFSEPEAGSDLAGLRTTAVLDGHEWVINGQKIWMTFGAHADWVYVLCRTNREVSKHKGISMLLVPVDQPGVDVRTIRNIAGGREFAEVFFTDARTSAEHVVGAVDGGWSVVMGTLGNERAGATVLPFQAAFEREMRKLIELATERGLTCDPVVRQKLAKAWGGLRIMQLSNDRMLQTVLHGGHPGPESSVNKLYWANWHRDVGELMVDLLGADALVVGEGYHLHPMQHTFLNSRAETIYGGANEIQRNIVGERVLGLPKEPS